MRNKKKIAIIGGGNVGRVLGVKLDILRHDVTIVESSLPKTICIDEYVMYNISGDFGDHSHLVKICCSIEKLDNDYDIIFVCTKLYDGMDVLKKIRSKINPNGAIVTIQNMYWIDRVSTQIYSENSVFMHMDFSCYSTGEKTKVTNQGGVKLGIISKEAYAKMQMVSTVLKGICKVEQVKDVVGFALGRNIINIAISLLGGISGKRLGKILLDKKGRKLFVQVIKEGVELFKALGINIQPYNNQLDYYLFTGESRESNKYRKRILKILRINNARVTSSILYDLEYSKKSEILTVVKTFIKHAQLKKVKIPNIIILYKMTNEIIQGKRRIDLRAFHDKNLQI